MTTELPRIHSDTHTNPIAGSVHWSPLKSLWYSGHLLVALIGGALTIGWTPVLVFLITSAVTLCLGHSLGMHRKLIHHSYDCPRWMEYLFVHLGVLVGMAGPFGMVHTHDLRDWAQRQPDCHPYLRHGSNMLKDAWWQLHCDLRLTHAPTFSPEPRLAEDQMYRFMERTWMLQQVPLAVVLFLCGGLPWVIWGISVRIIISLTGHWLIGYFAHNEGQMDHEVVGAAVQGHNVQWAGVLTMGESWHNNHHAFPGSAALGLYEGQADPGWWVLNALHNLGLVWHIALPEDLPNRSNLKALSPRARHGLVIRQIRPCPIMNALR